MPSRAGGRSRRPRPARGRTATMSVAWPMATSPMPRTLPPSSWMGRTVASRTSTTRLAFSCMTPIRIQVLYCVSMRKSRMMPDHRRGARGLRLLRARLQALHGDRAARAPPARSERPRGQRTGTRAGPPARVPRSCTSLAVVDESFAVIGWSTTIRSTVDDGDVDDLPSAAPSSAAPSDGSGTMRTAVPLCLPAVRDELVEQRSGRADDAHPLWRRGACGRGSSG